MWFKTFISFVTPYLVKYWMLLVALMSLFVPLLPLIYMIIILSYIDLITAWWRDKKIKNEKFKSHKWRKTNIKMMFYILIIMMSYGIPLICFEIPTMSLYVGRFAAFAFASSEFYSIAENMGIITQNNIFLKVVSKVIKKMTSYVSDAITMSKDE